MENIERAETLKEFRYALADMDRMAQEARENWDKQDVTIPLDTYVNLRMADRILRFLPRLKAVYKYGSDTLKAMFVLLDLMSDVEEAPDEAKEAE